MLLSILYLAEGEASYSYVHGALVSPHLNAQAPAVVCAGLKESVIENLSIIKVVLEHYLCICVLVFTSKFTVYSLCLLQFR